MDFTLPELGEQIESGDVLRVLVKAGDAIAKEQPVLELETDKATIEVPSSVAGTVKDVKVKAGDKVKVGQAISATTEVPAGRTPTSRRSPLRKRRRRQERTPKRRRRRPKRRPKGGGASQGRGGEGRRQRGRAARRRGAGSVNQA